MLFIKRRERELGVSAHGAWLFLIHIISNRSRSPGRAHRGRWVRSPHTMPAHKRVMVSRSQWRSASGSVCGTHGRDTCSVWTYEAGMDMDVGCYIAA